MHLVEEMGAGPVIDLGRFDDEAVVDIPRVWEIFGDESEKRGRRKEAENKQDHEDLEDDAEDLFSPGRGDIFFRVPLGFFPQKQRISHTKPLNQVSGV